MNEIMGTLVCALGGLAGAVFALPFRGIRSMRYESYWLIYAVAGLVVFPLALAGVTCPHLFDVIGKTEGTTLARCIGFGALWGLGGLTWGLMIRYLGIGLGLAIGCGLCSATGTLIPPIVTGHASDLVKDTPAVVTLVGVIVSLVGIVFVGLAGKLKESELPEEEKKKAVAEFNFKKGMIVAVFSGIASAGMNFGLQGGASMETAARLCGTDAKWVGMPVLVVVLWGGFAVNAAWCLWQNAKNKSFCDYRRGRAGGARGRHLGVPVRLPEGRRTGDGRHALHFVRRCDGQLRAVLVPSRRRARRVEGYGCEDACGARRGSCRSRGFDRPRDRRKGDLGAS